MAFTAVQPAAAAEAKPIYLRSRTVQGYLDVWREKTDWGSEVRTWQLNRNSNQRWYMRSDFNGNLTFVGSQSGLCIDVSNSDRPSEGAPVVMWDCNNNLSQQWIQEQGSEPGSWRFRNARFTGWCMDEQSYGDRVAVRWCNEGPYQNWYVEWDS
jgi:hypothetical protein